MLNWVGDLWDLIGGMFQTICDVQDKVVNIINGITLTEASVVTKSLGLFHYIIGTPLYIMFCTTLMLGAGFLIWQMIKKIVQIMQGLMPKLMGKLKIL